MPIGRPALTDGLQQLTASGGQVRRMVDAAMNGIRVRHDNVRELLREIVESCRLINTYQKNPLMPRSYVGPRFEKYREVAVPQYSGISQIGQGTVERICELLFEMDEQTRRAVYGELTKSRIAFALPALDAILSQGDDVSQERLREVLKMRMLTTVPHDMMLLIEPLMASWEVEKVTGGIRITRFPERYPADALRETAERARHHRLDYHHLKVLETALWQMGSPPAAMEEIWLILQGMDEEERIERETRLAAFAEKSVAVTNGTVPANGAAERITPADGATSAEAVATRPPRTLSAEGVAAVDAAGTLLGRQSAVLPRDLHRALIEAERILETVGPQIFPALADGLRTGPGPTSQTALRRAARLLHGELRPLQAFRQDALMRQKHDQDPEEDLVPYLQHLAALHTLIMARFTACAADIGADRLQDASRAFSDALAGLFAGHTQALYFIHAHKKQDKPAGHNGTDAGDDETVSALRRVLQGQQASGAAVARFVEQGATALDILRAAAAGKRDKSQEASVGYVRLPDTVTDASHIVIGVHRNAVESAAAVRWQADAAQPVTITFQQISSPPVLLAQEKIDGPPHLPGSLISLEETLGSGSDAVGFAYGRTQAAKLDLREMLDAAARANLPAFFNALQVLGIPLRLVTLRDRRTRKAESSFVFPRADVEEIGLGTEDPQPAALELLMSAGVVLPEDPVLLRVPAPAKPGHSEKIVRPQDHERAARSFLTDLKLNVMPLHKAKALLAIAGITLEKGTRHGRATDAMGRVRAVGNRVFDEGQIPMAFIIDTLFHPQRSLSPIGDKRALAEWVEQGGTYADL